MTIRLFLLLFSGAALALACSDETGKYRTGPDDPALKVTAADLAKVKAVLDEQEKRDREKGLRSVAVAKAPDAEDHTGHDHAEGEHPVSDAGGRQGPYRAATSATPTATAGGRLQMGMLSGVPPKNWLVEQPSSSMRLAQMRIPPSAGDAEPGELAVFHFGPEAGGVEQNLKRWFGQFSQPDGRDSREMAKVENLNVAGMEAVLIDLSGTMEPTSMPGSTPTPKRPGWRMLAAIVKSAQGPVFFKATGPEKTMEENREAMKQFVLSLEGAGTPAPMTAAASAASAAPPAALPSAPPQAPPAAAAVDPTDRSVDLQFLTGKLPDGWIKLPPSSSMRLAEARLPRFEGDPADGELAAFYFGPDAGGVQANLDRWYGQFTQPDGRPSKEVAKTEKFKTGTMEVTLVDLTGTMEASAMPGRPASPRREGWHLLGAIIMAPQGPIFIKATGPELTMAANREKMKTFLSSLKAK